MFLLLAGMNMSENKERRTARHYTRRGRTPARVLRLACLWNSESRYMSSGWVESWVVHIAVRPLLVSSLRHLAGATLGGATGPPLATGGRSRSQLISTPRPTPMAKVLGSAPGEPPPDERRRPPRPERFTAIRAHAQAGLGIFTQKPAGA